MAGKKYYMDYSIMLKVKQKGGAGSDEMKGRELVILDKVGREGFLGEVMLAVKNPWRGGSISPHVH